MIMSGSRMSRYCYKDVLPFTAMASIECANVGVNILFKAATLKGMSYYVFVTYTFVIAAFLLIPLSFIFPRPVLPPLNFHLLSRFFLLGLIGFVGQICAYKGIEYSSPTLASAISNLSPAFNFILAVVSRFEKMDLRCPTSQAKLLGTMGSISGALVVVLYKGPKIFAFKSLTSSPDLLEWPLESSESNWVIGGILLASAYLLFSLWYIIQAQVLELYPNELIVSLFYDLCGAIISAPICLVAEPNMSSWRLRPNVALVAVIYSRVLECYSSLVTTWSLHLKGPLYISIFRPLSIAIAAFMSAIFLGDSLHLGIVFGAIIISMGFYAVTWEEEERIDHDSSINSLGTSSGSTPLLQTHKVEEISYKDCKEKMVAVSETTSSLFMPILWRNQNARRVSG